MELTIVAIAILLIIKSNYDEAKIRRKNNKQR